MTELDARELIDEWAIDSNTHDFQLGRKVVTIKVMRSSGEIDLFEKRCADKVRNAVKTKWAPEMVGYVPGIENAKPIDHLHAAKIEEIMVTPPLNRLESYELVLTGGGAAGRIIEEFEQASQDSGLISLFSRYEEAKKNLNLIDNSDTSLESPVTSTVSQEAS